MWCGPEATRRALDWNLVSHNESTPTPPSQSRHRHGMQGRLHLTSRRPPRKRARARARCMALASSRSSRATCKEEQPSSEEAQEIIVAKDRGTACASGPEGGGTPRTKCTERAKKPGAHGALVLLSDISALQPRRVTNARPEAIRCGKPSRRSRSCPEQVSASIPKAIAQAAQQL